MFWYAKPCLHSGEAKAKTRISNELLFIFSSNQCNPVKNMLFLQNEIVCIKHTFDVVHVFLWGVSPAFKPISAAQPVRWIGWDNLRSICCLVCKECVFFWLVNSTRNESSMTECTVSCEQLNNTTASSIFIRHVIQYQPMVDCCLSSEMV